jgi:hypothetical protein
MNAERRRRRRRRRRSLFAILNARGDSYRGGANSLSQESHLIIVSPAL